MKFDLPLETCFDAGCKYTGLSPLPLNATVAMAYVPYQNDSTTYDDENALEAGTLFPVLNKPFLGADCK